MYVALTEKFKSKKIIPENFIGNALSVVVQTSPKCTLPEELVDTSAHNIGIKVELKK